MVSKWVKQSFDAALVTNIITTNTTIDQQHTHTKINKNTNSGNSIFIHWLLYYKYMYTPIQTYIHILISCVIIGVIEQF